MSELYLVAPLLACVASGICGAAILARDTRHRANRRAALIVFGGAFWAACEVLWNTSSNPNVVLWLVRFSALGWIAFGPLALDLFLALVEERSSRLHRLLPISYVVSLGMLLVTWGTPWLHASVFRTGWGWAYEFGWFYGVFYVFTATHMGAGAWIAWRWARRSQSTGEQQQARWIGGGILVVLCVASITDGVGPFLGLQWPRFGTLAFAGLGVLITWTFQRFGYSVIAPGGFTREIFETLPDGVALLHLDGRVRTANTGMMTFQDRCPGLLDGTNLVDRLSVPVLDWRQGHRHLECELLLSGDRPHPVAITSSLLSDKQGLPMGIILVMRDIRELVELRRRIVTSGRLAAVEELAGGIAHEISNPISYMLTNLRILREESRLEGEEREVVEECIEGADRIAAIVNDVKRFSQTGGGPRQLADLHPMLENALRFCAPFLPEGTRVERRFDELPHVPCAVNEMEQVFLNLVKNAAQAIQEGGRIRLTTRVDDAVVEVCVEDDGTGIATRDLERIFDPFFTTRSAREATGLGLAMVYEIVRRHQGDVRVESLEGLGSRFTIQLPIAEGG